MKNLKFINNMKIEVYIRKLQVSLKNNKYIINIFENF